jgi:adenosylhomocysteine nucleosidase
MEQTDIETLLNNLKQSGTYIICALPIEANHTRNIFYSGLGKINAAICAMNTIKTYNVKKLINYGSCGAINTTLSGIIKVNKFQQHDIDCSPLGFEKGHTPYDDIQEIVFPNDADYTCASGDYFVSDNENISSDVVDMEAYAIAKVCKKYNIEFECFKYISDKADADAPDNWEKNCSKGFSMFIDIVKK